VSQTFFAPDAPVIVQGITGRVGRAHTASMRAYGTNIVGGVSPTGTEVDGLPVFRTCAAALAATGATASVLIVPPLDLLGALTEALDAGIGLAVSVAEGMPVHDAMRAAAAVRAAGASWVGPSTPGLAVPGRAKLGFLPSVSLAPGSLGLMSKSGTLSYEVGYRLVQRGLGQSLWVGVGGDIVKGTRFADLVPVFEADDATSAMVVIGEIGGSEEEELAEALLRRAARKPVYALIAGASAREGVTMGHAGALVSGGTGTAASKTAALSRAGARVFTRIQDLVEAVADAEGSSR
jgi:succinyl-CoA synthetase alpha subunit